MKTKTIYTTLYPSISQKEIKTPYDLKSPDSKSPLKNKQGIYHFANPSGKLSANIQQNF